MSIKIPRFQGRTFEKDGRWTWKFRLSILGEDEEISFGTKLNFTTKEEATVDLKSVIAHAMKFFSDEFPEMRINSEKYFDLKTNSTRRWDKKDEQ